MSTDNNLRAERARTALKCYVEAKGEVFENSSSEVAELMADLLHLAVRTDQGDEAVKSTLRLARLHFEAEHGDPEEESSRLHVIDQALRASQRGYDPVMMAAAVFDALDIDPDADLAHAVRRIIQRNLTDTNFNLMAEEVTAAIEGAV